VLIPEENVKDLQDIPDNAKDKLDIVPVKWIDQVLDLALEKSPVPLPDEEPVAAADVAAKPLPTAGAAPAPAVASGDGLPH